MFLYKKRPLKSERSFAVGQSVELAVAAAGKDTVSCGTSDAET